MTGLIGKKIGMTGLFDETGEHVPCTVIEVEPCVVTQIKTQDTDGYEGIQLGFGTRKEKKTSKSLRGHLKASGAEPKEGLMEFRDFELEEGVELGTEFRVEDVFEEGDIVHVSGNSKGKGFQGVVKRHGFSGVGMATHGQHNRQRAPGSIGQSSSPSKVFKGTKMGGRTGGKQVTVRNLTVVGLYPDNNLILIGGAVPGPKNSVVRIVKANQ